MGWTGEAHPQAVRFADNLDVHTVLTVDTPPIGPTGEFVPQPVLGTLCARRASLHWNFKPDRHLDVGYRALYQDDESGRGRPNKFA